MSDEALAKQLANPVADLMSLPIVVDWDDDLPGNGTRLSLEPVIPIPLTEDLNLITRTILPAYWFDESEWGDMIQSYFFSPSDPEGAIWGAGASLLIPTSTDNSAGAGEWNLGSTGVALAEEGPWTYGALVNHFWLDPEATLLDPFVSYTTEAAWTFTVNAESAYFWREDDWFVPVQVLAAKVVRIGGQRVSLQAGVRYWLDSPSSGPDGWGARVAVVLLPPK
ncbi:MAG: transporter [Planctomycetes bacterium]|nr:transporter [Planctomycetota bacterium]